MTTNARAISLGLMTLFVGALPLSAQRAGEGAMAENAEHAELGKLEAMGIHNNRIVTALPNERHVDPTVYRSYDTDYRTQIEGLGSVLKVDEIPEEAMGGVVVVTFVAGGERPLAKRLYFTGAREVLETRGTIRSIDRQSRMLVLRNAKGQEERFNMGVGPGATIDSNEGLLNVSDLQAGQEVTVYFSRPITPVSPPNLPPEAGMAYLVFRD